MNGVSERELAFLVEMGIGPLWQLRAAPAAELPAPEAAVEPPAPDAAVVPREAPRHAPLAPVRQALSAAESMPSWTPPAPAPAAADAPPAGISDDDIARLDWDEL